MRTLLAGYILCGLLLGAIPSQRPIGANGRWLILVFVAYQLIPLAGVPGSAYSVARGLNWIMFAPLGFVVLDGQSRRVLLASALTVGTVLVLGVGLQLTGILGFTWGGLSLGGSGQFEQHATRYTSFLLNPNNLGLVMLILAVVVHVVTRGRTHTWRTSLLGSVLASACLAVVFMTSSRGAFIGIALVGFYWFAIARRTGHYPMAIAAGLLVAVIAVPFFAPSVAPTIDKAISSTGDIFRGSDDSAQARRLRWDDVLASNPNLVTGVGYGGYGDAAAGVDVLDVSGTENGTALTIDNSWLKLLIEEGVIGVLLFAAVMVAGIRSALTAMRQATTRITAIVASSILLLLAFQGISVDSFDINPWNAFLWLALALSYPEPLLAGMRAPARLGRRDPLRPARVPASRALGRHGTVPEARLTMPASALDIRDAS